MINENQPLGKTEAAGERQPIALLLSTDLMFSVPLQNMARKAGYKPLVLRPGVPVPAADVLVVDIGTRGDWQASVQEAVARGVPVIAFGPHMDADGRKAAKAAGASRVLANSNLGRDLPGILTEFYTRALEPEASADNNADL